MSYAPNYDPTTGRYSMPKRSMRRRRAVPTRGGTRLSLPDLGGGDLTEREMVNDIGELNVSYAPRPRPRVIPRVKPNAPFKARQAPKSMGGDIPDEMKPAPRAPRAPRGPQSVAPRGPKGPKGPSPKAQPRRRAQVVKPKPTPKAPPRRRVIPKKR